MFYGALEMSIMNVIWSLEQQDEDISISVSDIVKTLSSNDTQRAYTTIKTVMDRLVLKEILVRYKDEKKFFYRSAIDKNEAAKKAVEAISDQFFNGDNVELLRFVEKECEYLLV